MEEQYQCSRSELETNSHGPLRFLIISTVFPPELTCSARIVEDIARELAVLGDDVTVLAPFPNRPAGRLFAGYRRRLYKATTGDGGFKVIHCFSFLAPSSRMLPRFLENLSFGLTSGARMLFSKRPDVIYLSTWPIFATSLAVAIAKWRNIPVVLSVQDLYPESLAVQGRIAKKSMLYRFLFGLDARIARSVRKVIAISSDFIDPLIRGRRVTAESVMLVRNWDAPYALEEDTERDIRVRHRIPREAVLFVYAGNIGPASGAETLVEAFSILEQQMQISTAYLLIAGEGSSLNSCRQLANNFKLTNVLFHSPWPVETSSHVLRAADVLLLSTRGRQSVVSMPSKLISYMFAGRPILASVVPDSETAELLRSANAGWIIAPDSPEELANAVKQIIESCGRLQREEMGERARDFAAKNFSREAALPRVISELRNAPINSVKG